MKEKIFSTVSLKSKGKESWEGWGTGGGGHTKKIERIPYQHIWIRKVLKRVRKIPWRRIWQPTPVFLSGKFHGQRSLAYYSPWGHKESDMTEGLSMSWPSSRRKMTARRKYGSTQHKKITRNDNYVDKYIWQNFLILRISSKGNWLCQQNNNVLWGFKYV